MSSARKQSILGRLHQAMAVLCAVALVFSMTSLASFALADDTGASSGSPGEVKPDPAPEPEPAYYDIRWVNYDGSELKSERVKEGDWPAEPGAPSKPATAEFAYSFAGWSPGVGAATGNQTYTATYTETRNSYTITFNNYDGTSLWSGSFEYGAAPAYGGTAPTRPDDDANTYTFSGWEPDLASVSGDATYTATYIAIKKTDPDPGPNPDDPDPDNPKPDDPNKPSDTQASLEISQDITPTRGKGKNGAFATNDSFTLNIKVKNTGDADLEEITIDPRIDDATLVQLREISATGKTGTWKRVASDEIKLDAQGRPVIEVLKPGCTIQLQYRYRVTSADEKAGSITIEPIAYTKLQTKHVKPKDPLVVQTAAAESGSSGSSGSNPGDQTENNAFLIDYNVGWIGDNGAFNAASWNTEASRYIYNKGETVTVGAQVTWNDYTTVRSTDPAVGMTIGWSSSDPEIATVDANGVVTPQGKNGTVVITGTASTNVKTKDGLALSGKIKIKFSNQQENAVIRVFYANGNREIPLRGSGSSIALKDKGSTHAVEVYATIDYKGKTFSSRLNTGGFKFQTEEQERADCFYPGKGACYVWAPDTASDGSTNLVVSIVLDGNRYVRYVPLNVGTGENRDGSEGSRGGNVPSKLTISVSWEDDPNPENPAREEFTYTMGQLDAMAREYHMYTMIFDPAQTRKYAYQTARGIRLIALLNDCGIYESDIRYLGVKATDGVAVNSASMGMNFFLQPRYYYPYFYQGRKTSQAQIVPAMIAVSSRVFYNASPETVAQEVNTYAGLGAADGTMPRLVIGAVAPNVDGGRRSVRNVETIYVTLKGAPPENVNPFVPPEGEEEENENEDTEGTDNGKGGKKGPGGGTGKQGAEGTNKGRGNSNGTQNGKQGTGGGDGTGTGSGNQSSEQSQGLGSGAQAGIDMKGNVGPDAGGAKNNSTTETNGGGGTGGGDSDEGEEAEEALAAEDANAPKKVEPWSIWQMMSTAQSTFEISERENPWRPYAIPLADIMVGAGATRYLVWYRREKKQPRRPEET